MGGAIGLTTGRTFYEAAGYHAVSLREEARPGLVNATLERRFEA